MEMEWIMLAQGVFSAACMLLGWAIGRYQGYLEGCEIGIRCGIAKAEADQERKEKVNVTYKHVGKMKPMPYDLEE